jgi:hypothetical protein
MLVAGGVQLKVSPISAASRSRSTKLMLDTLARASKIKCGAGVVCSTSADVAYTSKCVKDSSGVSTGIVMLSAKSHTMLYTSLKQHI